MCMHRIGNPGNLMAMGVAPIDRIIIRRKNASIIAMSVNTIIGTINGVTTRAGIPAGDTGRIIGITTTARCTVRTPGTAVAFL